MLNPTECAEKILSFIKSDQDYSAFKKYDLDDIFWDNQSKEYGVKAE